MKEAVSDFDEIRESIHRQMLSAVSHDLKTPLATMIGSLEIFQRMYDRLTEDKRRTLVASALMEAYRLDFFISNILDMAKLENGAVRPHMSTVDLGLVIQDEIVRIGPRKERGIFHFGDGLKKATVTTDPALAGRVIGIMIDNCLKHAGQAPQIWLDAAVVNDKVVLSVRDDGTGLEAGKEEEIFSKYTRFGRADQRNAGTGLGLAIARTIARLLGGDLLAEKQSQDGALFKFSLPQT